MLFVPQRYAVGSLVDNLGANPSATPGTSVTPGISGAEGSWTAIQGALTYAAKGFWLRISDNAVATPTTTKDFLCDIGIDPAGGTSYTSIIDNIVCGSAGPLTAAGGHIFFFPLYIPAGSTIAARIQGSHGTATASCVQIRLYGLEQRPEVLPRGQYTETIGTITGTAGVSFTPGNAADGTWASLGTTAKRLWHWNIAYQISNATITAEYTYIEIAVGDATNKVVICRRMHQGTTSEQTGSVVQPALAVYESYRPVPAGSTIYIRGRCLNAPDTGYNGVAIGTGG